MANTARCSYRFKVSEDSEGEPWITLEPVKEPATVLKDFHFGFSLRPRTSVERAKEIAKVLNENLGALSVTRL